MRWKRRLRRRAHRLEPGACPDRGWRRKTGRLRAGLSQDRLARRICVRPGLAEAFERARALLSKTALRDAVHAGQRAPAAGFRRRADGCARIPARGLARTRRKDRRLVAACQFPGDRRPRPAHGQGSGACAKASSSTSSIAATLASTTFCARWPRASAKASARSANRRFPPASGGMAHRRRAEGGALGRLLRLLHGHRRPQMGPPLSDARVLFAAWGKTGGPRAAGARAPRRPPDRRRAQSHRRRRALRPQLGLPGRPTPACISSCATIRRWTLRCRAG